MLAAAPEELLSALLEAVALLLPGAGVTHGSCMHPRDVGSEGQPVSQTLTDAVCSSCCCMGVHEAPDCCSHACTPECIMLLCSLSWHATLWVYTLSELAASLSGLQLAAAMSPDGVGLHAEVECCTTSTSSCGGMATPLCKTCVCGGLPAC